VEHPEQKPTESQELKKEVTPESFTAVDGGEYFLNPRTNYYNELGKIIYTHIPEPAEGYTRLWRGSRAEEVGHNTIVTNSLIGIALPFMYHYNGVMTYVDVPTEEYMQHVQKGAVAPDAEFLLPDNYKDDFKIVDKSIYQDFEENYPDMLIQIENKRE